jgi:hypothetical protein
MRKHLLLSAAALVAVAISGNAENKIYSFEEVFGSAYGVSGNGKYAVGGDDDDNVGFIWDSEDPENIVTVESCVMHDVDNNGFIVGSYYLTGSYKAIAGYYSDDEWHGLPLSDDLIGESFAMCVSDDGQFIGGYQFTKDANSETGGRYYPCLWTRDEYGDYTLSMYNNIVIPDHQGFAISSMSEDGRVLAGQVFCGLGSLVPALLVDGQPVYFNEFTAQMEPWYYKGELYGYATEYYIDGFHDYSSTDNFYGSFLSMDKFGYVYGGRTQATNLQDDGTGTLVYSGCEFNMNDGSWTDEKATRGYFHFTGYNGNYISTSNGGLIVDGEKKDLLDYFGLTLGQSVSGLVGYSDDATVAAGTSLYLFAATGEYYGQPFFLKLDADQVNGVESVESNVSNAKVSVIGNQIVVTGAENVAVYSTTGQLISRNSVTAPAAGIYVVKADNRTVKVAVK